MTENQLHKAAVQSGVLEIEDDFLDAETRQKWGEIVSDDEITPQNFAEKFIELKQNCNSIAATESNFTNSV